MQPTRAQVVPWGPPSISTARRPPAIAARYAARPAVPAPMTVTSTVRFFIVVLVGVVTWVITDCFGATAEGFAAGLG